MITLTLAAWLVQYKVSTLRLPSRTIAGFTVARLAAFWKTLAGSQILTTTDP